MKNTFKGKVIVTRDNAKVGMKVQRGRDWKWGVQDCVGGKPSVGKIIAIKSRFWIRVKWENNKIESYRVGINEFDLVFADESYKPIINHL